MNLNDSFAPAEETRYNFLSEAENFVKIQRITHSRVWCGNKRSLIPCFNLNRCFSEKGRLTKPAFFLWALKTVV